MQKIRCNNVDTDIIIIHIIIIIIVNTKNISNLIA